MLLELLVDVARGRYVAPESVAKHFRQPQRGEVAHICSLSALLAIRALVRRGLVLPRTSASHELRQFQQDIPLLPFVATRAGIRLIDRMRANAKNQSQR